MPAGDKALNPQAAGQKTQIEALDTQEAKGFNALLGEGGKNATELRLAMKETKLEISDLQPYLDKLAEGFSPETATQCYEAVAQGNTLTKEQFEALGGVIAQSFSSDE